MPTTTWLAATTGQPPLAQQVNQLLTTHTTQNLYAGTLKASGTGGSGFTTTNGQWLAQSFTTAVGQTAIGYITAEAFPNGTGVLTLAPTTISLYTNVAGAPGTALITTALTTEYANTSPVDTIFPLPITTLTASTQYWIVVAAAGNGTVSYQWNKSSAASGASTSTNGTTWTAQAFGLRYQVFDQSLVPPLTATWEDGGQRWSTYYYANANSLLTGYGEYTAGQTTAGYVSSFRNINYQSGAILSTVS